MPLHPPIKVRAINSAVRFHRRELKSLTMDLVSESEWGQWTLSWCRSPPSLGLYAQHTTKSFLYQVGYLNIFCVHSCAINQISNDHHSNPDRFVRADLKVPRKAATHASIQHTKSQKPSQPIIKTRAFLSHPHADPNRCDPHLSTLQSYQPAVIPVRTS